MASRDSEYIGSLVEKLGSESPSTAKKALATLTKLTRNSENVTRLRSKGGLSVLLEFIRHPNQSHVDMALSALANCALDKECRREIRRLDGIHHLVDVLKFLHVPSILNRAARALANLAEDEFSVLVMDSLGTVSELAKALMEVSDSDCQETILRALRKLCTSSSKKQIVLDLDCFKVIVELLKSEKNSVANNCVRTMAEFTKNCSKELAQQVQEYDGIKVIVKLASSQRSVVRNAAVLSLAHLAAHSHVRVCIGAEGGIQALYGQLQVNEPGHVTSKAIEGLCYCCREAINRNRFHKCGALTSLLKLLSSGEYPQLHKKIVSAFTWFSYNEPCLEIMLNGGLVPSLISYLSKVISDESGCDEHEDYFCEEINLSFTSDISSPATSPLEILGSSSILSDLKDAMTNEKNSNETLEKLEDLAREVKDTSESSSRNFKRKLRMKSAQLSPGVQSVNVEHCRSASFCDVQSPTKASPPAPTKYDPQLGNTSEMYGKPIPCALQDLDTDEQVHISAPSPALLPSCSTPQTALTLGSASSNSTGSSPHVSCTPKQSDWVLPKAKVKERASNSSPVISNSDFVLYPWFRHHHSRGHCALLLLSRISQMGDPSDILVTKPCIQVLLDYLTLVPEPSPKCARLLNRLTTNPCCFEALVVKGIASQIHIHLCCGYHEKHPVADSSHTCQAQGENSATTRSFNIQSEEKNVTDGSEHMRQDKNAAVGLCTWAPEEEITPGSIAADLLSQSKQDGNTQAGVSPRVLEVFAASSFDQPLEDESAVDSFCQRKVSSCSNDTAEGDTAANPTSQAQGEEMSVDLSSQSQEETPMDASSQLTTGGISSVDTTAQVDQANVTENPKHNDMAQQVSPPQSYSNMFGHQLLENLANQAQTPFGKGILSHLLLRGSQEERQCCLLTLPHICRTKRLQGQMLIEKKGVRMLCDMLSDPLTEEELGAVVESLTVLANGLELQHTIKTFKTSSDVSLAGHVETSELATVSRSDITSRSCQAMGKSSMVDPTVKHFKVEPVVEVSSTSATVTHVHSPNEAVTGCCYLNTSTQASFDIHFKMDSGDLICAHRDVLSATTDVFSAMLSECYVEASQSVVTMPEMSSKVFTFALHCAYGCQTSVCSTQSNILEEFGDYRDKCEFLLEVLACADRFLFDKLKVLCEKLIIPLIYSPCDAVSICVVGTYFHSSQLCQVGLWYLLSRVSNPLIRRQSFKKILSSNEKLLIVDQLCTILLSHLKEII